MTIPTVCRPEIRLTRKLWLVIVLKLCCIGLLWFLFFSPSHRPDNSAEAVWEALFAQPADSSLLASQRDTP